MLKESSFWSGSACLCVLKPKYGYVDSLRACCLFDTPAPLAFHCALRGLDLSLGQTLFIPKLTILSLSVHPKDQFTGTHQFTSQLLVCCSYSKCLLLIRVFWVPLINGHLSSTCSGTRQTASTGQFYNCNPYSRMAIISSPTVQPSHLFILPAVTEKS